MESKSMFYTRLIIAVFVPISVYGLSAPDCAGCTYQSTNVGYLPHPDCTKFIRCERDGVSGSFTYRYYEQTCAPGTMWSQPVLNCITITDVCNATDPVDPDCVSPLSADPYNCAGYRLCLEGIGYQELCCPEGTIWNDASSTCIDRDTPSRSTCTDICEPCQRCCSNTCDSRADPTCPRMYIELVHGIPVDRECPSGTLFSDAVCQCVTTTPSACPCCFVTPAPTDCELYCPFRSDLTCKVNTWPIWVDNVDVVHSTSKSGSAFYDGDSSKQEIPYFANYFNNKNIQELSVSLEFRPVSTGTQRVGLINNGNCYNYPSFHISYQNGVVYAGFDTENSLNNGADLFRTSVTLGVVFTHIRITYDGTAAKLYKNGILVSTVSLTGPIRNSQAPMYLGFEGPFNVNSVNCNPGYFHGYIREVRVCLDV